MIANWLDGWKGYVMPKKRRGRDAVTGKFITLEDAHANPRETVVERRKRKCSGCVERQEIIDRLREEIVNLLHGDTHTAEHVMSGEARRIRESEGDDDGL